MCSAPFVPLCPVPCLCAIASHQQPFLAVTLALFELNRFPAQVFVGDTFCYFAGYVLVPSIPTSLLRPFVFFKGYASKIVADSQA